MLPNKPHGARPARPKTALLGVAVRRTVARYARKLAHAQPAIIASVAGGGLESGTDHECVGGRACSSVAPGSASTPERPTGLKFQPEIKGLDRLLNLR
jgi:hypothetical protein